MAPESRVVSVLGLRVVGGKLCSTLSTFFNLSLLLCCRPNLIAVVVVTEIRSSISSQAPQISKFLSFADRFICMHVLFVDKHAQRDSRKTETKKRETAFFCLFICLSVEFFHHHHLLFGCRGAVAVSTTRTSQRVKDSIQLRDSIRTLRLWI